MWRVTPITKWVASKNESNCLLENKMVSTCQITVVCSVKQCTGHRFSFMEGELHNESNFGDAQLLATHTRQGLHFASFHSQHKPGSQTFKPKL